MPLSRWRAGASERSGKAGKVPNGICAAMQMDWSIVAVCVWSCRDGFLGLTGEVLQSSKPCARALEGRATVGASLPALVLSSGILRMK